MIVEKLAGNRLEITPEMAQDRGVYWREHSVVILNLMDLGANAGGPVVADKVFAFVGFAAVRQSERIMVRRETGIAPYCSHAILKSAAPA